MKRLTPFLVTLCLATLPLLPAACVADDATPPKILLPLEDDAALKNFQPSSEQVTLTSVPQGVAIAVAPGKDGYPGVNIKPDGGAWDLSNFGHVEARITNTGDKNLSVLLRVDNAGDWKTNPWNTESKNIKPGQTGVVKVIFGYAYDFKKNFALNPEKIVNMVLFVGKSKEDQSFRLESLTAAGPAGETPPIDPNSIRTKPVNGFLLGGAAKVDAEKQIAAKDAQTALDAKGLRATFAVKKKDPQSVTLKPAIGRWDLRDAMEVRVKVRNDGATAATPKVRLESNSGASVWASTETPLAPGAGAELVIPFDAGQPLNIALKKEQRFGNNVVSGVTLTADPPEAERVLTIESVVAATPPANVPAWLGKRPPVEGEWTQTLAQEFNGPIDNSVWNLEGSNFYDKRTHWSKDEVSVKDGLARLNYQKKTGFQNDDPAEKQTDYAAGFMDSYGKWTQRYGYFESRIKLPRAPGLWPAFWLMPDRGTAGDPRWKRQMTEQGGMEFDIMEHLTGWGPNRNNVAMHYDGYDKNHKVVGADKLYIAPDKDGFVTYGLLWTPGSAIYYANGREIARWENERIGNQQSYIIFTLPSGGWDNLPLDDAQLPDAMQIDYVRVWQRKDLASPADGKKVAP